MSIVAPKGRKHLSADALFQLVRSGFAKIPDYRSGDPDISLTDALMSAFAMFSLTSPSLLAFDPERRLQPLWAHRSRSASDQRRLGGGRFIHAGLLARRPPHGMAVSATTADGV